MATRAFAEWIHGLEPSRLSAAVNEAAIKSFHNYVGCAIGGHNHAATQIAIKSSEPFFAATTPCSLLGSSLKVDALHAALINATAAHVHDYDDTHLATVIHPTASVAAALLAYAEHSSEILSKPISGNDFLCALVAGIEIECRLGLAVWPSHYDVGWHITATVGSIGAAVAVGKAMGLSVDQLRYAIGIASVQVAGMRHHFGSHSKPLGVGLAAQAGLQAALLANGGMTAAADALEGKRGWVACVCPEQQTGLERLTETLDRFASGVDGDGKWEIEKNAFKPFPCGIVIHPIIDGCIQLHDQGTVNIDRIESVELNVHPLVLELTGKKDPKDGLQAKFSVYHGAACGLMYGRATPAEYSEEVVVGTAALRDIISVKVDSRLRADECCIAVQAAGKHYEKYVKHAVGSLAAPMTEQQLHRKFLEQTAPVIGEVEASALSSQLMRIQEVGQMSNLVWCRQDDA